MPFITQGKTNWKYVIIVLILATILGVVAWQYLFKSQSCPYLTEPTENETEKFLGDESKWDDIKIELKDIQGLFGGRNISISGKGETIVEIAMLGFEWFDTKTYNLLLNESEIKGIINTFIKNDFVTITTKDKPGLPDEVKPEIVLTNAGGEQYKIAVWDNDLQENKRFMNIYQELLSIEKKVEIIDWETYRNEEYGFEFEYPPTWEPRKEGRYPFIQLVQIKGGEVISIVGGITIFSKPIFSESPYAEMFTSISRCPDPAGSRDLSSLSQYEEYVYCLTGDEIEISAGTWKGAVECSASWWGMGEDFNACSHQFWIDTKYFFFLLHFNFFQPIEKNSAEAVLFETFLKGFSFFIPSD